MAPGIPSIANLSRPSKPEDCVKQGDCASDSLQRGERISTDPFPFLENESEMMQLVLLGRDSQRAAWKPEDLAEDPLPEPPDTSPPSPWPSKKELLKQDGQDSLVQFMRQTATRPEKLQKEVRLRRGEPEPLKGRMWDLLTLKTF
eukprot:Skav231850  [mRNA]  locus=scaffold2307:4482:7477:+ [translate_table: standard]